MLARIVLGLSALVWLPYGIFCFVRPDYLDGAAGVASTSVTGTIELRAMYGGLQAAIGLLCAAGLLWRSLERSALLTLCFLTGGLCLSRLAAGLTSGVDSYTFTALLFEGTTVILTAWLLVGARWVPVPTRDRSGTT